MPGGGDSTNLSLVEPFLPLCRGAGIHTYHPMMHSPWFILTTGKANKASISKLVSTDLSFARSRQKLRPIFNRQA